MYSRAQLLFAVVIAFALLSPACEAGYFTFTSRTALETYFGGYVADIYFDLIGQGTAGNYYDFGTTRVPAADFSSYPEFRTNPFLLNGYLGGFNALGSVGNTLLAALDTDDGAAGFYLGAFAGNYADYAQALGFYVTTAPGYEFIDEDVQLLNNGAFGLGATLSDGDFIGIASTRDTLASYTYVTIFNDNIITGVSHMVMEPGYMQSGGDPHFSAFGSHSDMGRVAPGDVFRMIAHPQVVVDAAIRAFEFLPASMQESNYYGSIGLQLANGDEVVVTAFEDDVDGTPAYLVLVNGAELAFGSAHRGHGYELHYNTFGDLPLSRSKSHFDEEFPFQTHHAIVRLHVPGALVVDVSLSSKDAFVDWHQAVPQVYRQAGAFLNMNMRELVQPSETEGLLPAMGREHRQHTLLQTAVAKAEQLVATGVPAKSAAERSIGDLAANVAHHRAALEAFDLQKRVEAKVAEHQVPAMFA